MVDVFFAWVQFYHQRAGKKKGKKDLSMKEDLRIFREHFYEIYL